MANNRDKKKYGGVMARLLSNCERKFPSLEDEKAHDLACAIIEQAVYDWAALRYGKLAYFVTSNDHFLVKRSEVEAFFMSDWFEFLLAFAIPNLDPNECRRVLNVRCEG